PSPGGVLARFDAAAIKAQPGVLGVVEIPSGLAVVAAHFWQAKRALDAADLVFAPGPLQAYSTQRQRSAYRDLLNSAALDEKAKAGDAPGILHSSAKVLTATFEIPAQAHATMEPMNCTASVSADRCELWVPTQGVEITHAAAKQLTGLRDDQIVIHRTLLVGGFGRRLLADFSQIAIMVAKAMQRPVKV